MNKISGKSFRRNSFGQIFSVRFVTPTTFGCCFSSRGRGGGGIQSEYYCRIISKANRLQSFSSNRHYSTLKYFEIFGLQPKFKLDWKDLRRKFLALQVIHHPDKSNDTLKSTEINKAYETLKNPLLRAKYISGTITAQLPSDFLMFVYDVQDDIQEGLPVDIDIDGLIKDCVAKLEGLDDMGETIKFQEETVKLGYYYNIRNMLDKSK